MLSSRAQGAEGDSAGASAGAASTVIAEPSSLIGDLLDMDIGGEAAVPRGLGGAPAPDLLDGGLDQLLAGGPPDPSLPRAAANNLLGNIFGLDSAATSTGYTDRYLKVSGLALSPLRPRRMTGLPGGEEETKRGNHSPPHDIQESQSSTIGLYFFGLHLTFMFRQSRREVRRTFLKQNIATATQRFW